jgi:tetratricopeptide (TPR) repeat protein
LTEFSRIGKSFFGTSTGFRVSVRYGILARVPSFAALFIFLAAPPWSADPPTTHEVSLQRAKQLAWLSNWAEAARVLERLQQFGWLSSDKATALFARAVEIRGNIEALSLPWAAKELAALRSTETAWRDPELRLQILAMEGDVEFQYDLSAAEKTWTEVRRSASALGRRAWEARAGGELGTIAFLNGQAFTAVEMVATAYVKAEIYGDIAAQVKQLTALGEGQAEFSRPADAIRFFNKALALSSSNPDIYFPFTAYLGKARLLLATTRGNEGRRMLLAALARRSAA